ncbi:OLC1v1018879C1 [Oldenlandia corymbosa var. corymbosa]|uniref:OLC1v1018879C1 n=1 Tax=Oldenlandia corymbosa var. corymbosa TaxID=529605 RepID=A0AAV1ECN8_OLDCO|nr:OLC1v1018879C1 [Oldenlandia corymbosa var. corymbosa]
MAKGIATKFNLIILVALFFGSTQPTKSSNDTKDKIITQAINELKLAMDNLNSISFEENNDGILELQSALGGLIHALESKGSAIDYSDVDADIRKVINSFKSLRESARSNSPESLGAVPAFPFSIMTTVGKLIVKVVGILAGLIT